MVFFSTKKAKFREWNFEWLLFARIIPLMINKPPSSPENMLEILMSMLLSDPKFKLAIEGVLLSIVAIFGLIGNSLAIAVLSRPSMRSPINLILIGT